jgi:AraC-like DNA-binding protein
LFGGGLDAFGEWGLAFRKRDDLLFCWLERGECLLLRPDGAPLPLRQGDFVLIRTSTPFSLASDASVEAVDSEAAVLASGRKRLSLGSGADRPVSLHAGKFVVQAGNEGLLAALLPQLVHIAADDPSVGRVRTLLAMNEMEARQPGPASEFVTTRLVELILMEILRTGHLRETEENKGVLAGLADKVTARAIAAMHEDVARDWTVAALAKLCGVSRSGFATRFSKVVGVGPRRYLLEWRIALAKDELQGGAKSIAQIAFAVGFQSSSAFSSAFAREVGVPPTQFGRRPSDPPRLV